MIPGQPYQSSTEKDHFIPSESSLDRVDQQIRSSGYAVITDIIPKTDCDVIRGSVTRAVQLQRENYPNAPKNVGFTPGIINHDQSFAKYLVDVRLMKVFEALLGHNLRISFTSAIINQPGNERGDWHAYWPFNQRNAGHIPAPYPDVLMHITTLWMLSPFEEENGGTLIVPGSHRESSNPTCSDRSDEQTRFDSEINIIGPAGSVLVMDSRLWHATAPNLSSEPRVALAVRYAPWWLNLDVLRPGSDERKRMCDELGKTDNVVPPVEPAVFERLPTSVKPLYRHWVG